MKSIIFVSMFVSVFVSVFVLTTAALLPVQAVTAQTQAATSAANDQGKTIFIARCGKCHDADASKKLPDGTTLLARLARNKDPEARLGTRLKDAEQRRQVFLYLKPLIERERLSGTLETAREKAEFRNDTLLPAEIK
jgi:cytochrome c553